MVVLRPISFTFLNLSVPILVKNYLPVYIIIIIIIIIIIPLHINLPIYRSLGVTKFRVYTSWCTIQIHFLELR